MPRWRPSIAALPFECYDDFASRSLHFGSLADPPLSNTPNLEMWKYHTIRFIACAYTVLALLAASYAWVTDILMRNDPREHMLPDLLLMLVGFPLSFSVDFVGPWIPWSPNLRFFELAYFTVSAAVQACGLWWIAKKLYRIRPRAND